MRGLRGRVVLVDFWTYSCINCLRTLPYLKAWDQRYRRDGLTIVGVHTPEFPFEHEASNVAEAIERNGLRYPVVQDNEYGTWDAYGNQYWPAEYFIDARGDVRYVDFGEGVLRQEGTGDPRAARRSRPPGLRPGAEDPRRRPLGRGDHPRDLPRRPPGPNASPTRPSRPASTTSAARLRRPPTNSPTTGAGASACTRRPPRGARSTSTSAPGGCTWCWAPPCAATRCGCSWTVDRSRAASPGRTSTTAPSTVNVPAPLQPGQPAPGRTPRPHACCPNRA